MFRLNINEIESYTDFIPENFQFIYYFPFLKSKFVIITALLF